MYIYIVIFKKPALYSSEHLNRIYRENKELFEGNLGNYYRSFVNYKIYKKSYLFFLYFLMDFISFFINLIIFIPIIFKKNISHNRDNQSLAFFDFFNNVNVIPSSLKNEYRIDIHERKRLLFDKNLFLISIKLFKLFPFNHFFILKTLTKLSMYNYLISTSDCSIVASCAEDSYISPIITEFLNSKGIQHFNLMHGEVTLDYRIAFNSFNKVYVWDGFYLETYNLLYLKYDDYRVEDLNMKKIDDKSSTLNRKFVKYYLQAQDTKQLKRIAEILELINNLGYEIVVRPHPNLHNPRIKNIFKAYNIENSNKINISDSLSNTLIAVSTNSTVLMEAYKLGIDIMIDDLTDLNSYQHMFEIRYFTVFKKHLKLSEFLND